MTTPQELFQENKELSTQLAAVIHSNWFAECLVYARAVMLDNSPTTEELAGAKKFREALIALAPIAEPSNPPLTSGLHHDLSIPVRTAFVHTQTAATKPKS